MFWINSCSFILDIFCYDIHYFWHSFASLLICLCYIMMVLILIPPVSFRAILCFSLFWKFELVLKFSAALIIISESQQDNLSTVLQLICQIPKPASPSDLSLSFFCIISHSLHTCTHHSTLSYCTEHSIDAACNKVLVAKCDYDDLKTFGHIEKQTKKNFCNTTKIAVY